MFGAPAAVIERIDKKEDCFEIWPENWRAIQMFLKMQTQWVVGVNGASGLNYQSLEVLFRIYKVKNRRRLFESIREIEFGALEAICRMNEEKKAGPGGT